MDSLPSEPPGKHKNTGQPVPSPGGLPDPGIELGSPALQVDSFPALLPGKPHPLYHLGSPKMQVSSRPNYIEHVTNSKMFSLILSTLTLYFPLMIGRGNK